MRSTGSAIALGLLLCTLLTGCEGMTTDPPTGSVVAQTTPSPTAPVSGSPADSVSAPDGSLPPKQDRDDPSTWQVSGDGLGPVRLGEDISTYPTVGPFVEAVGACADPWVHIFITAEGSRLYVLTSPEGTTVEKAWLWNSTPSETGLELATPQGISEGASFDEVQAAYPDLTLLHDHWGRYGARDGAGWLMFIIQDGVVQSIVSSMTPGMQSEYCS